MKLETYLESNSLWDELGNIAPNYLLGYTSEQLTSLTTTIFGDKTVNPKIETMGVTDVALAISMYYDEKWAALIANTLNSLNLASDGTIKTVTDGEVNETGSSEGESLRKISAFNSPDLITDGGESNANSNLKKLISENIKTHENLSFSNVLKNLSIIEKVSIIRVIVLDVVRFTTISIY